MTDPWIWAATTLAALAAWLLIPPPPRLSRLRDQFRDQGDDGIVVARSAGQVTSPISLARRAVVGLASAAVIIGVGSQWLGWSSAVLGAVIGTGVAVAVGRLESTAVRRRQEQSVSQLPQVLDLLASGLTAGLPLRSAAGAVIAACPGPVADDIGRVQQLIAVGMADVDAWRTLAGHPQLGPVALDLARSVESGTRLVSTLTSHAADARIARRSAFEIRARQVGVHSVAPLMLCFIPAFLVLGVVPTVASALIHAFDLS